ncbi:MAG: GNAT family N-acetyltransferase [Rhodospirillales bacterium]|jgi:hypothetical protein|nr:GNAT family N-acetyltransferase [Rhodospirillales bacterium]
MGRFEFIDHGAASEVYTEMAAHEVFSGGKDHPVYGNVGRNYYAIALGEASLDLAFVVTDNGGPVLLVQCALRDTELSHFGFPIRFNFAAGLPPTAQRKSLNAAFEKIGQIAAEHSATEAFLSAGPPTGSLGLIDKACLDRDGKPGLRIRAEADLELSGEELKSDLRSSYKSLINWGRDNIRLEYVNAANPDRLLLEKLSDFHAQTAGRIVHAQPTWDELFRQISIGHGEISMGFAQDGELVAGTMVIDEGPTALYFLAVYDRERFEKPIGHWPLFDAMVRAKNRGLRRFDLGEVHARGTVEPKEFNIGFFKKGFTSRLVTETVWRVPL